MWQKMIIYQLICIHGTLNRGVLNIMGRDPNLRCGKDYWGEAIYPKNHIDVDHP